MKNTRELSNILLFRQFVSEGSKEAINQFFKNQMDLFYRIAYKYTKNAADAEDVLQAAFIGIMDTAHQYKGIDSEEEKLLQSWCITVVVHCALMKIRSESSRRKRETGYSITNSKPFYEEENMDTEKENKEIHQKVQNAILNLPEKYRIPIHLKYIEGFDLDAIANILKLNASTLRSLMKRGLEKVSTQLKEEKITMSSIGLVGLIEAMPIQKAPMAYEAIATKIFNPSSSARLLLTKSAGSFSVVAFKALLGGAIAFLAIASGYFMFYQSNEKSEKLLLSKVSSIGTNQTWSFINPQDRSLEVLIGSWKWDETKKYMMTEDKTPLVIQLPIKPQKQIFMLEIDCVYFATLETKHKGVFFRPGWVVNDQIIKVENKSSQNSSFEFKLNKPLTIRVYFYQNYFCTFLPDNSFNLEYFDENINTGKVGLLSVNLLYKSIKSKSFDMPPKELLQVLETKSDLPGLITESWNLKEPILLDEKIQKQ